MVTITITMLAVTGMWQRVRFVLYLIKMRPNLGREVSESK